MSLQPGRYSSVADLDDYEETFERETAALTDQLTIPVKVDEIVSHDVEHVVNYAAKTDADVS